MGACPLPCSSLMTPFSWALGSPRRWAFFPLYFFQPSLLYLLLRVIFAKCNFFTLCFQQCVASLCQ